MHRRLLIQQFVRHILLIALLPVHGTANVARIAKVSNLAEGSEPWVTHEKDIGRFNVVVDQAVSVNVRQTRANIVTNLPNDILGHPSTVIGNARRRLRWRRQLLQTWVHGLDDVPLRTKRVHHFAARVATTEFRLTKEMALLLPGLKEEEKIQTVVTGSYLLLLLLLFRQGSSRRRRHVALQSLHRSNF